MGSVIEAIGRFFYSRESMRKLEYNVNTAGFNYSAEGFAGLLLALVLLFGIILTIFIFVHPVSSSFIQGAMKSPARDIPIPVAWFFVFIFSLIVSYCAVFLVSNAVLTLRSDSRRNDLETSLPDFLLLVSANIKAGMPLDQALYHSAKSEYGMLSREVRDIIKRSFSGESLEQSLDMLAKRFDSRVFTRTISLIKQSSATGGEVSAVLERTSQDVRSASILKKEVSASLILYEIFILFACVVGTPFLFAVSGKLIEVFEKTPVASIPQNSVAGIANSPFGSLSSFKFGGPVISSNEFFYFTLATIFVTSLFASFIVGVIRTGSKNEGMKYFPFVLVISYIFYFMVSGFMNLLFTTIQ